MKINTTTEIDNVHLEANIALKNKDIITYMSFFTDDMKYKQLNGQTINKDTLIEDTKRYFGRIKSYNGVYTRLDYSLEEGLFIENLVQKATVSLRIFIFFQKKWTIEREGIYKWKKENNKWKIFEVEVKKEKMY